MPPHADAYRDLYCRKCRTVTYHTAGKCVRCERLRNTPDLPVVEPIPTPREQPHENRRTVIH